MVATPCAVSSSTAWNRSSMCVPRSSAATVARWMVGPSIPGSE